MLSSHNLPSASISKESANLSAMAKQLSQTQTNLFTVPATNFSKMSATASQSSTKNQNLVMRASAPEKKECQIPTMATQRPCDVTLMKQQMPTAYTSGRMIPSTSYTLRSSIPVMKYQPGLGNRVMASSISSHGLQDPRRHDFNRTFVQMSAAASSRQTLNTDLKQTYQFKKDYHKEELDGFETYAEPGEDLLDRERDACGVGFVASIKGEKSNHILKQGLSALECNDHRGGCNYDGETGDGSGVMAEIPWTIFQKWADKEGLGTVDEATTCVGQFFLQNDEEQAKAARDVFDKLVEKTQFKLIGWRQAPIDPSVLGDLASTTMPLIWQPVLDGSAYGDKDAIEIAAYVLRRQASKAYDAEFGDYKHYIVGMSARTMIWKGMVSTNVLQKFYRDLEDPDYVTNYAVYHRRFSTNTLPRWSLAQPFRNIAHNGEINTYLGNINWSRAREGVYQSDKLNDVLEEVKPVVGTKGSDSAALDNMVELLVRNGEPPMKALMLLQPEAYNEHPSFSQNEDRVQFYEFYAGMQEPWDGPANVTFCDGKFLGASLDRNGLRPARYEITDDGYVYFGSEIGSNVIPQGKVTKKGRLGPGTMFAINLEKGEILQNKFLKEEIAWGLPYRDWLKKHRIVLKQSKDDHLEKPIMEAQRVLEQQAAFGISSEDLSLIITQMATTGKEPTISMGEDTPLAFLAERPRVLYDYFKQRFAQVTNPPIDPLREGCVMSLDTFLGHKGNILQPTEDDARQIKLESPVLTETMLETVMNTETIPSAEVSLLHKKDLNLSLEARLSKVVDDAVQKVQDGAEILVLSDEGLTGFDVYVPSLLATGAVHHKLLELNIRSKTSIVVKTAQCWSTHQFAVLIGFGASAICPYLAYESIRQQATGPKAKKEGYDQRTVKGAQRFYTKSVNSGLKKILSKMGISLLTSYHGAQIFEIIGISDEVCQTAFRGSSSRVSGLTFSDIEKETEQFLLQAYSPEMKQLENAGFFRENAKGEYHFNSRSMVKNLHKALEDKDYDHYRLYEEELSKRPATALRDLFKFQSDREPVSIDQVESIEDICQRFFTGGMSLGALSPEAHETIAIAMNRIGGMSNSGEGGEDKRRFKPITDVDENGMSAQFAHLSGLKNGDIASSGIKQVASGRFGVTAEYLNNAKQLEIKIAQGAKPGEGGQLPGAKVDSYIAGLRYSKPGVGLISPPPHHDIYSIEDLAQLIYDLHEVNTDAKVSVKLVASAGIGTVASGVVKANADVVQISGHEGGTGASPASSMKHAGGLWELALSETHQALQANHLRERVKLRVDGGIRAGWEVVMGACLGADQFGFGTIAMIAEGCIMARVCHLNSCPVGIATQKENLRKRYTGTPENVVDFFMYLAQEVREIMAQLGYTKIDDLVGQTQLLTPKPDLAMKASNLNLERMLDTSDEFTDLTWQKLRKEGAHSNGSVVDDDVINSEDFKAALENPTKVSMSLNLTNVDRAVGARIAGVIAKNHGDRGFAEAGGELEVQYTGTAGQSFGAFNIEGMKLVMSGQSNDYVGKSMNGGTVVVKPAEEFAGDPSENVIVGNTCLYGANGGLAFFAGRGGERFAVRNSGVHAVVEGVGDHACEYMTGGRVVCLGGVGRNMGAGMTGGLAYVLPNPVCNEFECDLSDIDFLKRTSDDIRVQRLKTAAAKDELKDLIQAHFDATGSTTAQRVLENWDVTVRLFWQVIPPSEDNSIYTTPQEQLAMMAPQKITGEQPVSRDGTTEMGGSEKEVIMAGGSIDEGFMDKQFK